MLNQTHLNSDDYVAGVLNFGGVTYMTEVMWLYTVPLSFEPIIRIKSS